MKQFLKKQWKGITAIVLGLILALGLGIRYNAQSTNAEELSEHFNVIFREVITYDTQAHSATLTGLSEVEIRTQSNNQQVAIVSLSSNDLTAGSDGNGSYYTCTISFSYQTLTISAEIMLRSVDNMPAFPSGYTDAGEYGTNLWAQTVSVSDNWGITYDRSVIANTTGQLKINKRAITITANDASKFLWESDPRFSGTVEPASYASYGGTIQYALAAGTYGTEGTLYENAIVPQHSFNSSNYDVTCVAGDFLIRDPAVLKVYTLVANNSGGSTQTSFCTSTYSSGTGPSWSFEAPAAPTEILTGKFFTGWKLNSTVYQPGQAIQLNYLDYEDGDNNTIRLEAQFSDKHILNLHFAATYCGAAPALTTSNITGMTLTSSGGTGLNLSTYSSFNINTVQYTLDISAVSFATTQVNAISSASVTLGDTWHVYDASNNNCDYMFTVEADVVINPKPVTVTVANAEKFVWDTGTPLLSGVIGGLCAGDSNTGLSFSIDGTMPTAVGTYTDKITATFSNTNYTISVTKGTLTIKEAISVTVTYNLNGGSADFALTQTFTQSNSTDDFSISVPNSVPTKDDYYFTYWTNGDETDHFGKSSNVTLLYSSFEPGTGNSVTFDANYAPKTNLYLLFEATYCGSAPALTDANYKSAYADSPTNAIATLATFAVGDDLYSLTVTNPTYTTTAVNVGSNYPVTIGGTWIIKDEGDNDVTYKFNIMGYLEIVTKAATITVNNASKNVWASNPVFSGSVAGLVEGDELANLSYGLFDSTIATPGVYENAISATYDNNANYFVSIVPGNFTIIPAVSVDFDFDLAGGTGTIPDISAKTQTSSYTSFEVQIPNETPVKSGYYFAYWYCEALDEYYLPGQVFNLAYADFTPGSTTHILTAVYLEKTNIFLNFETVYNGSVATVHTRDLVSGRIEKGSQNATLSDTLVFTFGGDVYHMDLSSATFIARAKDVSADNVLVVGGDWKVLDATNQDVTYMFDLEATLQITPKTVTIDVNNASKIVWQANPVFTGTVTGLVAGDSLGTVKYGLVNNLTTEPGVYTQAITASYSANSNYNVVVNRGNYTIIKAVSVQVVYNLNGGVAPDREEIIFVQTSADDSSFTIVFPEDAPVKEGFEFTTWKVSATGLDYDPTKTLTLSYADFQPGLNTVTLTANYEELKAFNIHYTLYNDKAFDVKYMQKTLSQDGTEVELAETPVRAGYHFLGWVDENGNCFAASSKRAVEFATAIDLEFTALWCDTITAGTDTALKAETPYYLEGELGYTVTNDQTTYYGGNIFYVAEDSTLNFTSAEIIEE